MQLLSIIDYGLVEIVGCSVLFNHRIIGWVIKEQYCPFDIFQNEVMNVLHLEIICYLTITFSIHVEPVDWIRYQSFLQKAIDDILLVDRATFGRPVEEEIIAIIQLATSTFPLTSLRTHLRLIFGQLSISSVIGYLRNFRKILPSLGLWFGVCSYIYRLPLLDRLSWEILTVVVYGAHKTSPFTARWLFKIFWTKLLLLLQLTGARCGCCNQQDFSQY